MGLLNDFLGFLIDRKLKQEEEWTVRGSTGQSQATFDNSPKQMMSEKIKTLEQGMLILSSQNKELKHRVAELERRVFPPSRR